MEPITFNMERRLHTKPMRVVEVREVDMGKAEVAVEDFEAYIVGHLLSPRNPDEQTPSQYFTTQKLLLKLEHRESTITEDLRYLKMEDAV